MTFKMEVSKMAYSVFSKEIGIAIDGINKQVNCLAVPCGIIQCKIPINS